MWFFRINFTRRNWGEKKEQGETGLFIILIQGITSYHATFFARAVRILNLQNITSSLDYILTDKKNNTYKIWLDLFFTNWILAGCRIDPKHHPMLYNLDNHNQCWNKNLLPRYWYCFFLKKAKDKIPHKSQVTSLPGMSQKNGQILAWL